MKKVKLRDLEVNDLVTVKRIHQDNCDFPWPQLSDGKYFITLAIEVDGKVIGAIVVRLTSEMILIIDHNEPQITRAQAVMQAGQVLSEAFSKVGMDECHVFASDIPTAKALSKLGFVFCEGVPMVWQSTKGNS